MKRVTGLFIGLFLLGQTFARVAAADSPGDSPDTYTGQPLCPPAVYLQGSQDCLPLGPSVYLTQLARQGITLPPPPLPAYHTPLELATIPYQYILLVGKAPAPVHASLEDGMAHVTSRVIPSGYRYLSYKKREETEQGIFYLFQTGEWIEGSYVSRVSPPRFEGLVFRATPRLPFGWVLDEAETRRAPGNDSPGSGYKLVRFDMVTIFNTSKVGDTEWLLVGPDEWVEKKFVARVIPNSTPPAGVDNGRWIELNIYEQTLMAYDQGRLVFATLMSSGLDPFFTKPGLFKIYKKKPAETMSTSDPSDFYYLEDVPWTMYFDEARAIHGAYWHSLFGYPRSHGCINLSIGDARWIYDWAREGEWVYAWDPSGKTPTDPSFYTSGGP